MRKVALFLPLGVTWQGGLNYFHNFLGCYRKYPSKSVTLEVFTDLPAELKRHESDAITIHPCPQAKLLSLRRPSNWPRRAANQIVGYDLWLLRIAERYKIDLLTHNTIGRQSYVKTLFWQADLQHKVFPHFFSARERAIRDEAIDSTTTWGHILLSSQAAATDIRRFYPRLKDVKTHVLHFSSAAILDTPPIPREELNLNYPTEQPYFFLPNQFWKHKNHGIVVDALRRTPPHIRVICTGPMTDPRDPSYVPGLIQTIKDAGLEDRFICLGTVPYSALVSLMHHSLAVLQPSLFEGWSTSVEESKAMHKRILLSNINVHIEQAPARGTYFSPDEPEQLAALMTEVHRAFDPVVERLAIEERICHKSAIERDWMQHYQAIISSI